MTSRKTAMQSSCRCSRRPRWWSPPAAAVMATTAAAAAGQHRAGDRRDHGQDAPTRTRWSRSTSASTIVKPRAGSLTVTRGCRRHGVVSGGRRGALGQRRDAHAHADAARGRDRYRDDHDAGHGSRQGCEATRSFQVAVNAKNASIRALTLDTFAKADGRRADHVNGLTIQQDADDPAMFAAVDSGRRRVMRGPAGLLVVLFLSAVAAAAQAAAAPIDSCPPIRSSWSRTSGRRCPDPQLRELIARWRAASTDEAASVALAEALSRARAPRCASPCTSAARRRCSRRRRDDRRASSTAQRLYARDPAISP